MLPAPFYAEVPTDLGDDQTWVDEAAGVHSRVELRRRPGRSLRALIDDLVAAGALMLVSRVRRMLAV
jgi:hypothetical protein